MSFPNKAEQVGVFSSYAINPNDIGNNWQDLGVITSNTSMRALCYLGNGIVAFGDISGHIFRSVDYGKTWTDLGAITGFVLVTITYIGNGIVIGANLNGHVFRSTDYGLTWSDEGAVTTSGIETSTYFGNGIAIFGTADGHIWRSSDYGLTWNDLGAISGTNFNLYSSAYLDNGIAIIGDQNGHIFRSTDFGLTWTDLGVISGVVGAVCYLGNGITILADSNNAHIFRSVDLGLTWTDLGQISTAGFNSGAVYIGDGIALIPNSLRKVFKSMDFGLTWTNLGDVSPSGRNNKTICYIGNGIVLVGGEPGGIIRSDISYKLDENIAAVSVGISTIGNTSGTTGLGYQQVVLAGGSNVTLSQSITSGSGTLTISNVTAAQTLQTQFIIRDVNISGNTTGTTADITSGTMTLAGGNNITLSQAGNAITIVGAAPGGGVNLPIWQNSVGKSAQDVFANFDTFALVELNPAPGNIFPGNMTVSTMFMDMSLSVNSSVFSASHILGTFKLGIYTRNVSTLSILNSVSTTYDISSLTTDLNINLWLSINSSLWSDSPIFSATQYYLGYIFHSSSGPHSISLVGNQYLRTNQRSGTFNGTLGGSTSMGHIPYVGVSVSSINGALAGLPVSIQLNELQKTGSNYAINPHVVFMNLSSAF